MKRIIRCLLGRFFALTKELVLKQINAGKVDSLLMRVLYALIKLTPDGKAFLEHEASAFKQKSKHDSQGKPKRNKRRCRYCTKHRDRRRRRDRHT